MRKDALGAYAANSSSSSNTPCFDNFCGDAVVFSNCVAPASWTVPSHASFFTGMYPSEHQVHETREAKCLALTKAMNKLEPRRSLSSCDGEKDTRHWDSLQIISCALVRVLTAVSIHFITLT